MQPAAASDDNKQKTIVLPASADRRDGTRRSSFVWRGEKKKSVSLLLLHVTSITRRTAAEEAAAPSLHPSPCNHGDPPPSRWKGEKVNDTMERLLVAACAISGARGVEGWGTLTAATVGS